MSSPIKPLSGFWNWMGKISLLLVQVCSFTDFIQYYSNAFGECHVVCHVVWHDIHCFENCSVHEKLCAYPCDKTKPKLNLNLNLHLNYFKSKPIPKFFFLKLYAKFFLNICKYLNIFHYTKNIAAQYLYFKLLLLQNMFKKGFNIAFLTIAFLKTFLGISNCKVE